MTAIEKEINDRGFGAVLREVLARFEVVSLEKRYNSPPWSVVHRGLRQAATLATDLDEREGESDRAMVATSKE